MSSFTIPAFTSFTDYFWAAELHPKGQDAQITAWEAEHPHDRSVHLLIKSIPLFQEEGDRRIPHPHFEARFSSLEILNRYYQVVFPQIEDWTKSLLDVKSISSRWFRFFSNIHAAGSRRPLNWYLYHFHRNYQVLKRNYDCSCNARYSCEFCVFVMVQKMVAVLNGDAQLDSDLSWTNALHEVLSDPYCRGYRAFLEGPLGLKPGSPSVETLDQLKEVLSPEILLYFKARYPHLEHYQPPAIPSDTIVSLFSVMVGTGSIPAVSTLLEHAIRQKDDWLEHHIQNGIFAATRCKLTEMRQFLFSYREESDQFRQWKLEQELRKVKDDLLKLINTGFAKREPAAAIAQCRQLLASGPVDTEAVFKAAAVKGAVELANYLLSQGVGLSQPYHKWFRQAGVNYTPPPSSIPTTPISCSEMAGHLDLITI